MEKISKSKGNIFTEIRTLIVEARQRVAVSVNAELSLLYWNVGKRINDELLGNKRADYGRQIVDELSMRLTEEFGPGWKRRQLFYCIRFASEFPETTIVHTLCAQLSWSHIKDIIAIEDGVKREFYAEMCKLEHWSVRTLRDRINSMLYERTAIARKPDAVIKKELAALRNEKKMSPELAFRDPYFLDFLGLHGEYSEKDLERAMVAEMRKLILELGGDMAFMAEQKRISVDNEDYYIDLLFYHRRMKRLVAIDLKIGSFKAEYQGQMHLYLKWLEKNEMMKGEKKPIGLILCAGKNEEHVRLLELERNNIRIATYMTELPPKNVLEEKFRVAIETARNRIQIATDPSK